MKRIILVALTAFTLAMGFSLNGFAADPQFAAKGLYYAGLAHQFSADQDWLAIRDYNMSDDGTWSQVYESGLVKNNGITGSIGGCVFNGLLYCFFTTSDGKLQYVAVNPTGSHSWSNHTIATKISATGAAAAVLKDVIYVFTASHIFRSGDGTNFSVCDLGLPPNASAMLDAVTFFPANDYSCNEDTAGILVVYLDNDENLCSSLFCPSSGFTDAMKLPWPPVDPYLWSPVTYGNLVLGTSSGGAKTRCIQFYGITGHSGDGWHMGRWEFSIADNTWTFHDASIQPLDWEIYRLGVCPYFKTLDSKGTMQLVHFLNIIWYGTDQHGTNHSDYMVPQHNDPNYGWDGVPTETANATGDDDKSKALRNFWSLVGIVLGPPPFAMNGAEDASGLSEVQYGHSQSTSVTTTLSSTKTLSVATNEKIEGGFGEANLDFSYAHGWTSSHGTTNTVEVSSYYTFGPASEMAPDQGIHGWAIFNAPVFVTQQYKLYAYDYDISSGQGTYLNQDMYATSLGSVAQQTGYFDLANPEDGMIQGLFQGLTSYPHSTDLASWHGIRDWNGGGSDWEVKFGDKSNPPVGTLNQGVATTQQYTQTNSTVTSNGNTNSYNVAAGASFNIFEGFSAGITVGYDAEFEVSTDMESSITNSVSSSLNMPIPASGSPSGYVKSLVIQPYWLQAETNKAPWIPTGYNGNLPWCITWNVLSYQTVGGTTMGTAPPPASAGGTIQNGENDGDYYKVETGRLVWIDNEGNETLLSMTADQFDPARGAAVSLNGYIFAADGTEGKWLRKGDAWKYRTKEGVKKDRFVLSLDFGSKTWSFRAESKNLEQNIKAANGLVHVNLNLQGSYVFAHWLKHDVNATWHHEEKQASWNPHGIHEIKGAHNSQKEQGYLVLKGHFPKEQSLSGDTEVIINGISVAFPLLTTEKFLDKLQRGGIVTYEADGMSIKVDFGRGRWKARIEDEKFQGGMVPKDGEIRVKVLVGGVTVSDQTFQVQRHSSALTFGS